ncbi:MAG: transcription termination factor Rho [Clostridiaceae bacterium]|jgi:transcription termination factor Rho|nr:transcription termination factor Rho [Clostridiaceae bacterium]
MAQPDLRGKTKKDLAAIAHISGLLQPADTSRMTKQQLLDFLLSVAADAEEENGQTSMLLSTDETSKSSRSSDSDERSDIVSPADDVKDESSTTKTKKVAVASAEKAEPSASKTKKTPSSSNVKDTAIKAKEKKVSSVSAEKDVPPTEKTAEADSVDDKKTTAHGASAKREPLKTTSTDEAPDENETTSPAEKEADKGSKRVPSSTRKVTASSAKRTSVRKVKTIRSVASRTKEEESSEDDKNGDRSADTRVTVREIVPNDDVLPEDADADIVDDDDLLEEDREREQEIVTGILEVMPEGYGFLRVENYIQSSRDIYVPPQFIRRFNLRIGDEVTGPVRQQRDNDRYKAIYYIREVNGMTPDKMIRRPHFDRLTPIYPNERYTLETGKEELSTRIIDLVCPIGKGQRGMIVSPPKAGKTILLQKIANAISENNPEAKLMVLLIDERPEEVTDMQRSINGEVIYSTFDKTPDNHVRITELVLERAERLVELGRDVVILLDSITRMSRAYNLTINPTGRTLSGGLDPGALYGPKRFFGAARNIENGGSLTIIATALVETGSRMDEVIFEEFKGTGNMEVILDRKLADKRIFPAIDITHSGTRREELLLSERELNAVWVIRKAFSQLETATVTETMLNMLLKTRDNDQFISSIKVSISDKSLYEAMRGSALKKPGTQQNNDNNG